MRDGREESSSRKVTFSIPETFLAITSKPTVRAAAEEDVEVIDLTSSDNSSTWLGNSESAHGRFSFCTRASAKVGPGDLSPNASLECSVCFKTFTSAKHRQAHMATKKHTQKLLGAFRNM